MTKPFIPCRCTTPRSIFYVCFATKAEVLLENTVFNACYWCLFTRIGWCSIICAFGPSFVFLGLFWDSNMMRLRGHDTNCFPSAFQQVRSTTIIVLNHGNNTCKVEVHRDSIDFHSFFFSARRFASVLLKVSSKTFPNPMNLKKFLPADQKIPHFVRSKTNHIFCIYCWV